SRVCAPWQGLYFRRGLETFGQMFRIRPAAPGVASEHFRKTSPPPRYRGGVFLCAPRLRAAARMSDMAARSPTRQEPAPPAADLPTESAARVLRQFRRVFNTVKTHFRAVEKKAGLAGAQVWALSVVAARPGIG